MSYHSFDGGHFSLGLQIHLVCHQEDGYFVGPLDPDNLVLHGLDILEGLVVGEAVADDEALSIFNVEVPHRGELLSPRRVQDFQDARTVVNLDRQVCFLSNSLKRTLWAFRLA